MAGKFQEQPLCIGDGSRAREVAMRWTTSHQDGWTLIFDTDVPETFRAYTLFETLALYRATIEPEGWRLLHAAARTDCWADPRKHQSTKTIQQLTPGVEQTVRLEAFDPAAWEEVTDLDSQRANFEAWMASLTPVPVGRVRPRAGHEHDPVGVEFSGLAAMAGEYLVDGKANIDRLLGRAKGARGR